MNFSATPIQGAFTIEAEPISDNRGYFARTYCQEEFTKHGLIIPFVQCNLSHNHKRGTIRGMHYQSAPFEEAKVVSCTQGSIYDVIIDMRPSSASYLKWFSVELNETNTKMIYIPEGCAHGFQTLEDGVQVYYQMSSMFEPSASKGIRWNDPFFNIEWPLKCEVISDKDLSYPDFIRKAL